jgi:hypothetical protein
MISVDLFRLLQSALSLYGNLVTLQVHTFMIDIYAQYCELLTNTLSISERQYVGSLRGIVFVKLHRVLTFTLQYICIYMGSGSFKVHYLCTVDGCKLL